MTASPPAAAPDADRAAPTQEAAPGAPFVLYGDDHWDSPFVFTVFVALHELGVPFETRVVNLGAGEQRTPEFQRLTITGRVPALARGELCLTESLAILEWLRETHPSPPYPPLLPVDGLERARARQVLGWLRSDLAALKDERPTTTLFFARAERPLSERAAAAATRLCDLAQRFLGGRASVGAAFSVADADLALALHRLLLNGDPVPADLRAYAEAHWQRPSVQAFVRLPRPGGAAGT